MISPQHREHTRIPKFVGKQQGNDFNVVGITVYVVALEQILFVRWRTYLIEESEEILKLAMSVSRNYDRGFHFYYYWFFF